MNEDLDNIQFSPILNYDYAEWFQSIQYNGKTLNDQEREEYLQMSDEEIERYSSGLSLMFNLMKEIKGKEDESHVFERILFSSFLYVTMTTADCMVASKYFLLANTDYDKRYMRGKLKVILNEGFKKLYGFKEKKDQTIWSNLSSCMKNCPDEVKRQYQELTTLLEKHAQSSSWWKEERDTGTHLETDKLYESRMIEVEESKTMTETVRLLGALYAVDLFLSNVLNSYVNGLQGMYKRGELIGQ